MAKIDPYKTGQTISNVKSGFAESYLKPLSENLQQSLLVNMSSSLKEQITQFLQSYEKDLRDLEPILVKYKTYRRYARYPANMKDYSERISFILPKPNEIDEMLRQDGTHRAFLVACLMMKTYFIALHSKLLLQEISKIPRDTASHYSFDRQKGLAVTKYKALSIFEEIEDMIGVLDHAVTEYFELKAELFQKLGRYDSYRPGKRFPTHWDMELRRTQIDIVRGDDSAIYHVRTALELMLQITLKYFEDPELAKNARRVTTIRVAESCKKIGIHLPISVDLIERINYYSNLSLHRGRRFPLSDVWHMLNVLVDVSRKMEKFKLNEKQLSELKRELREAIAS